jgi:hypothetical protein
MSISHSSSPCSNRTTARMERSRKKRKKRKSWYKIRPMVGGNKNETFETNERKKRRFLFFRGKRGMGSGAPRCGGKKDVPQKKFHLFQIFLFHSTYHQMQLGASASFDYAKRGPKKKFHFFRRFSMRGNRRRARSGSVSPAGNVAAKPRHPQPVARRGVVRVDHGHEVRVQDRLEPRSRRPSCRGRARDTTARPAP